MQQWGEGGLLSPDETPPAIGLDFDAVRVAALRFARRPAFAFNAGEIGEQVLHLGVTVDILRREQARLMGVFAATEEADIEGFMSPLEWLRLNGKMSMSNARELEVVGSQMAKLPAACEALDRGEVGMGHLVHMARNARFSELRGGGGFDEAPLLELAREESVGRFRHTCMNARHAQDPALYEQNEVSAVESREMTFNPMDNGTTYINLLLDQAEAAYTRSVLEARAKRLGPDDHRGRSRRLADAFVEVMHQQLSERDGGEVVGRQVCINVTCTAESLMGLKGAPGASIDFGDPISGAALARLACEARITKILLDGRLIPVGVGTMKRVLTKAERRALNARDGHCRYPGCHRPPSECEAHHIVWWSRGGKTELKNMILLCAYHHWRVHEGGWLLVVSDDLRQIRAIPPQLNTLARPPGATPVG
jgi:hypothetical protein